MRKYLFLIIAALVALPSMATDKPYTVVLDAGHGGKDPGAVGSFSKEKDLNLKLALKVGELLNEQYPDVNVVYTRSTDVFIPLQERADIANKNNADLFISIHANSSESKVPRGVETFILGTEKMEKNLDVAMRENAVMKLEADYKTTYHGFDPNSIDSYIMFELMQNSFMDQSLQFAEQVQKRFVGHLNRSDRGVQQASFWVLLKTACPSILFEMGFISNPEEERYLNQDASMAQMANALVNAFGAYTHKQAVKKETLVIESSSRADRELIEGKSRATEEKNTTSQKEQKSAVPTQTYYAVQVCAAKILLKPDDPKLKGQPCEYIQNGDWYKYYTAADTDRAKVAKAQKELKRLFPDCWIIKFEKEIPNDQSQITNNQ
ncbi:MAG: N-acetylmuramoyl-L-alanine amidase [Paludibacteraceae bacterium]|nr:N-acetylmuramoyl-L-alanine amidase [Paludibacteraceae bacterium]